MSIVRFWATPGENIREVWLFLKLHHILKYFLQCRWWYLFGCINETRSISRHLWLLTCKHVDVARFGPPFASTHSLNARCLGLFSIAYVMQLILQCLWRIIRLGKSSAKPKYMDNIYKIFNNTIMSITNCSVEKNNWVWPVKRSKKVVFCIILSTFTTVASIRITAMHETSWWKNLSEEIAVQSTTSLTVTFYLNI